MNKIMLIVLAVAMIVILISLIMLLNIFHTPSAEISPTTSKPLSNVLLQGAGSSLVYPQLNEWIQRFYTQSGIKISYQSVGSGAGLSMFFQNVTDFACSDPPLSKDMWKRYEGRVMQIPWLAGPVAIIYNIPELPKDAELKLDANILAGIYNGSIVYWDDDRIKMLNPDIANMLPHKEIIPVYRTDASGTTEIFTTFLYKATNGAWSRDLVGKTVNWPVAATGRGIGGKGSEGVTQTVIQTPYSIGYVEWSYAILNNLPTASIKNAAGRFVKPSEKSVAEALANVNIPQSPLDDFSNIVFESVYASGDNSYPITAVTHIVLWKKYQDSSKALALAKFLRWVVDEGYNNMIQGYVAPPQKIKNLLLEAANILEKQVAS